MVPPVEDRDLVAAREEPGDHLPAHELGTADHEGAHRKSIATGGKGGVTRPGRL